MHEIFVDVAELADALDLESSGATRAGSSPVIHIIAKTRVPEYCPEPLLFYISL